MIDEPTSGLDPVARDEVCYLLPEFASGKGKAVMFSTHITSDLEKVADRVVFILNGGIVCAGDKDALLGGYVLVTGSPDDVDAECSRMIIGYRCQGPAFEGVASAADAGRPAKPVQGVPAQEVLALAAFWSPSEAP